MSADDPAHKLDAPNEQAPSATTGVPLLARLAHEIPKPLDWQMFQRLSVILFRSVLNDPHAQEYGRSGQDQRGIDILGKRNSDPNHHVGVQCRLYKDPLEKPEIMSDCRRALTLVAGLKEIIFATTAPDDTHATNAAIEVEQELRAEGHDISVVLYGWGALRNLIATHESAYAAFVPSYVANRTSQVVTIEADRVAEAIENSLAPKLEQMVLKAISTRALEEQPKKDMDGDPTLHGRIDAYRDILKKNRQIQVAEAGLKEIVDTTDLSAKPRARFRIETILGSIALDLGRYEEGAKRFEAAYTAAPADSSAMANMALARIIQGKHDEAMDWARKALDARERSPDAVGYLLQAAARSDWSEDPKKLIPADLENSEAADIGLCEFLKRRNHPDWPEQVLEICRKHPGSEQFKPIHGIAMLTLALEGGIYAAGGRTKVSAIEIELAAVQMSELARKNLDQAYADHSDLMAQINNAAILLRMVGKRQECCELLERGIAAVGNAPELIRLLALEQTSAGNRADAIRTLEESPLDPECQLLSIELTAIDSSSRAFERAKRVDPSTLTPRMQWVYWRVLAGLALEEGDRATISKAASELQLLNPHDVIARLLPILAEQLSGVSLETIQDRVRAEIARLPTSISMPERVILAEQLRDLQMPEDASRVLDGHLDLARKSPIAILYLQCLASARRDHAFRSALSGAGDWTQQDPTIQWTIAVHLWNVGDLEGCLHAVEVVLVDEPDDPRSRLLKLECLARLNRSVDLLAELEKPIESLQWDRAQDKFRIVAFLRHFGHEERAAAFAYKLFVTHRDEPRAWMTLSSVILNEGRRDGDEERRWEAPFAAPHVAVDVEHDDGEELFFVIEPDAELRRLDPQSWELTHDAVCAVLGKRVGDRFSTQTGRSGTIRALRHKYIARFHDVLKDYETRFPTDGSMRRVQVDPTTPDGLDALKVQLIARREWIAQEQEHYENGPWSIGVLAHRLGMDTIEVAQGIGLQGGKLKVAEGTQQERSDADDALIGNGTKGCVLDLLTFWNAWHLGALDVLTKTCGQVHVPQSVVDRLLARRERLNDSSGIGIKSMSYDSGKIILDEAPPHAVVAWRDDVDRALSWIAASARVMPTIADDQLPANMREHLRSTTSDVLDCVFVAHQLRCLLVSDDLPTREISLSVTGAAGVWLHRALEYALHLDHIDADTLIRWSAHLVDAGQNYLGVSGLALTRALHLDQQKGTGPGYLFRTLCSVIGGPTADPDSHIRASLSCLSRIWSDRAAERYRQPATSILLRNLIRGRSDYREILARIIGAVSFDEDLSDYIIGWVRGHFVV